MNRSFLVVICFCIWFLPASQAKDHSFDGEFEQELEAFVVPANLEKHEARLRQKKTEFSEIIRRELQANGDDVDEREIMQHKFIVALDIALKKAAQLKKNPENSTALRLAQEILDIEASLKTEGQGSPLLTSVRRLGNALRRWKIKKTASASEEASNLFLNGSYLSAVDRAEYRGDLSLVDPAPGSTYWQKPDSISRTNLRDAALGKTVALYEGIKPHYPDDNTFYYEEVKYSDTKPKIDAYAFTAQGKKRKFKLKFGAEIHSDPTISVLTLALGYPADLTKHARNVRVVLGKKVTFSDLKRDWELYYRRDKQFRNYNIEKYVQETGVDAGGNNFVVFKEGLIEAKPKEIDRLGAWDFKDVGRPGLRELRGLSLVQMWLSNTDIKESANNRQLLKYHGGGEITRHHIISDLGFGFGAFFPELPELYPRTMVHATSRDSITLNYRSFYSTALKHNLTFADARWATRLIAALTREQLEEAVNIGAWPVCVARIYVEKMVSRRNDLVKHLELEGVPDHDGNPIAYLPQTTDPADLSYDRACDDSEISQDFTTKFDFSLGFFLKPAAQSALNGLLDLARSGIGSVSSLSLSSAQVGFDSAVISEVLVNVKRTIEANPKPSSEKDIFIAQDHFEVGLRLGYSYGVFADSIYKRSFTLAYPVRSKEEGRMSRGFIVDALLPLHLAQGKLPESYVLKTEHYLETGVGLEFDRPWAPVTPVLSAKRSRVLLLRSFLDHQDSKNYLVYRDRTKYDSFALQLLVRVAVLKLPVLEAFHNWGTTVGSGARIDESTAHEELVSQSIHDAVVNGRFGGLRELEDTFQATNHFRGRSKSLNLFLLKVRKENRFERIELSDASAERQLEVLQYLTRTDLSNSVLRRNETSQVSVEIIHLPKRGAQDLQVNINVDGEDSDTTDDEMERNYLRFVNGLSINSAPLIPLTPSLGYTTNGRWGKIVTQSRTTIYPEGLRNILGASESEFWKAMGASSGLSEATIADLRSNPESESTESRLISKAERFWVRLCRAKNSRTIQDRMITVAEAFRGAAYRAQGFVEPRIIGALHRLAGTANVYSFNTIGAPLFAEQTILNEAPLYGTLGEPRSDDFDYMLYDPKTPTDLYFLFDNWKEKNTAPIEEVI